MATITLTPEQTDQFWSRVNKTASCWLWTAGACRGYGSYWVGRHPTRKRYGAHRVSFALHHGYVPPIVDHICHTPLCVNPHHLRPATAKQNQENRLPTSSNKSGVRGVRWRADRRKWRAEVKHLGKTICVGHFMTLQEADAAARAARIDLFTHNDHDRI